MGALAIATRWFGRHFENWWRREADAGALWLPVGLAGGIATYFALPFEPQSGLSIGLGVAATALVLSLRHHCRWRPLGYFAITLLVGFVAADLRNETVAAPALAKRVYAFVEGTVIAAETRRRDVRLTLTKLHIDGLAADATPHKVRITVRNIVAPRPGTNVRLRATLLPPPTPVTPGAFDFARQAWFQRLGGMGYATGSLEVLGEPRGGLSVGLESLRQAMSGRIRASLDGPRGGIAAALMTGDRAGIAPADMDALRDSGLAHLLAISGLHVGLVAGLIFFATRLSLAAWPRVAERWPIKKWSAAAALAAAFAYLWLTGATVPTQRAFIMTAVVMVAVMIDRRAISMRLVAVAAAIVLLVRPESLLGVSFQMSFAAVVALIAAYDTASPMFSRWRREASRPRRIMLYLAGVLFTTLIAGLATMPFAAYHFNKVALYGLAANALAVPATALWIMPWALVSYAALPFGLERAPLAVMGWGIEVVRGVAHSVADWPQATLSVPASPGWGLAFVVAGGLWLCLWRSRARVFGLVPLALAPFAPWAQPQPSLMIDAQARYVAAQVDGGYAISRSARSYTAKTWLRRTAATDIRWPKPGHASEDARLQCTAVACRLATPRGTVLISDDPAYVRAHCDEVILVISREPVRGRCKAAVIDRFDVWRHGAHAVWVTETGLKIETAHRRRGDRPWVDTTPRQWDRWRKARASSQDADRATTNSVRGAKQR